MDKPTLNFTDYILIGIIFLIGFILISIFSNQEKVVNIDLSKDSTIMRLDSILKNQHDSIIILQGQNQVIKEKYYYESKIFNNYIPDSMRLGYIFDKSKELLSDSTK